MGEWKARNWGFGFDNRGTLADPYAYIDGPAGGPAPSNDSGRSYFGIQFPYIAYSLDQHLMPWMKYAAGDWEILNFADRAWDGYGMDDFDGGWYCLDDPCAPVDPRESRDCQPYKATTNCVYYKVTWGPDPTKERDCIRHNGDLKTDGRWGTLFHSYNNGWSYRSWLVIQMWDKLRACADETHPTYPCEGLGPKVEFKKKGLEGWAIALIVALPVLLCCFLTCVLLVVVLVIVLSVVGIKRSKGAKENMDYEMTKE